MTSSFPSPMRDQMEQVRKAMESDQKRLKFLNVLFPDDVTSTYSSSLPKAIDTLSETQITVAEELEECGWDEHLTALTFIIDCHLGGYDMVKKNNIYVRDTGEGYVAEKLVDDEWIELGKTPAGTIEEVRQLRQRKQVTEMMDTIGREASVPVEGSKGKWAHSSVTSPVLPISKVDEEIEITPNNTEVVCPPGKMVVETTDGERVSCTSEEIEDATFEDGKMVVDDES